MKNRPNPLKKVLMMTFFSACILAMLLPGNAMAADLEKITVEMLGYGCTGVGYEQGADLLKGDTSTCANTPSGNRLSNVKLMWMGGSTSDGTKCEGAKQVMCTGTGTVPLEYGANGKVCSAVDARGNKATSLWYTVGSTICAGKTAWKVTFTSQH